MKRIVPLLKVGATLLLFGSPLLFARAPDTVWTRTYGGNNGDVAKSVGETTDGGYIIAGYTNSYGAGSIDVYLIRIDANGDTLWTRTYGGSDGEAGESVQQTTDGGYIIAGIDAYNAYDSADVYLIKVDANGNMLWSRIFGGDGVDWGRSVQQTSDGGYIITGYTNSYGAGGYDVYLIKTDQNGDTLWTKTFGGSYGDYGHSVVQTIDGGYVIVGDSYSFSTYRDTKDIYLIKTDINGDTLWTRTYGDEFTEESGRSVQQTTDDGYIIAGYTNAFGGGSYDVYLIKTDSRGDTLWTRTYGEAGSSYADFGHSVQQTVDGGYIIAVQTKSFGGAGSYDAGLIKTDANGNLLWAKVYGGQYPDAGYSVVQTIDGGYILAGQGNLSGSGDVYVVKTEPEFAAFVVTPTGLDFGDVSIGLSKSDSVQVTNAGNGAILNITSVVSDNEVFAVTPATGSVNPAQSMQFYITFTPIDPGAVIGNIIFVHNAAASPDTVTVAGNGVVGIDETRSYSIPSCYGLTQNYPNPFKVETGIRYQLPRSGVVTIAIYNVSGQRVRTLVEEHADAGYYAVHWDGRSQDGKPVSNGVYFCQMKAGDYTSVKKILLTR